MKVKLIATGCKMSALLISTVSLERLGLVFRADVQEVVVYYTEVPRRVRIPVTDTPVTPDAM